MTGNGFRLPAGPLREPLSRLQEVDVLINPAQDMIRREANCWLLQDPKKNPTTIQFHGGKGKSTGRYRFSTTVF